VIGGKNGHGCLLIGLSDAKESGNDSRRRASIARLYNPLRWTVLQIRKIKLLVPVGKRIQHLLRRNVSFGSAPGVLKKSDPSKKRAELFRTIVATNEPGERPETQPFTSCEN